MYISPSRCHLEVIVRHLQQLSCIDGAIHIPALALCHSSGVLTEFGIKQPPIRVLVVSGYRCGHVSWATSAVAGMCTVPPCTVLDILACISRAGTLHNEFRENFGQMLLCARPSSFAMFLPSFTEDSI